jgi:hypothetical protein
MLMATKNVLFGSKFERTENRKGGQTKIKLLQHFLIPLSRKTRNNKPEERKILGWIASWWSL